VHFKPAPLTTRKPVAIKAHSFCILLGLDNNPSEREFQTIMSKANTVASEIPVNEPRVASITNGTNITALKKQHSHSADTANESRQQLSIVESENKRSKPDLVCLSHLRWNFVYQRPQHLLSRCARDRRVFFFEEPIFDDGPLRLEVSRNEEGVIVATPHIPHDVLRETGADTIQQGLIEKMFTDYGISDYVLWYYTPMALGFTEHLKPIAVVYDCMDELSAFKNAPAALHERESQLFNLADLVFTGGQTLYESKRDHHHSVHAFPSSIDAAHFAKARGTQEDPSDQRDIAAPRIGFFGVIDERMDLDLIAGVADARPDWHLVMIGPVVKIDEESLPQRSNIHYLGGKSYKELPSYLSGWDVAMLPFARNESTRFISPTKTPEYLAAGCPVVSTSIRDVVRPYGQKGLVHIADTVEEFVSAIETAMQTDSPQRLMEVDAFLKQMSWDLTWSNMSDLIQGAVNKKLGIGESDHQAEPKQRAAAARASA
jgi:UDP-galactopyranose mutase